MHKNPFDATEAAFLALVNSEGQWSLWPARVDVPGGWRTGYGPARRDEVLAHIESAWPDIRVSSVPPQPAATGGPTS